MARRNPGDAELRRLERAVAMGDTTAGPAYQAALARLGQQTIALPGDRGHPRPPVPKSVVFYGGSDTTPIGWYLVSTNGTWSRDRWTTAEDAIKAAGLIQNMLDDGSVILRESGSYCGIYIPHGTGGMCMKTRGHRGQCAWSMRPRGNPDLPAVRGELPSQGGHPPRATWDVLTTGKAPLVYMPESAYEKPAITTALRRMYENPRLMVSYDAWDDLLAAAGTTATVYVFDRHGERYKVVRLDPYHGYESGQLVLHHVGRRGEMRVDLADAFGFMLPVVAYKPTRVNPPNPGGDDERRRREREARAWGHDASAQSAHEAAAIRAGQMCGQHRLAMPCTACDTCDEWCATEHDRACNGWCDHDPQSHINACVRDDEERVARIMRERAAPAQPARFAPWVADTRGDAWGVYNVVTGAWRRVGAVGATRSGRRRVNNGDRARALAERLNRELPDDEVLAAFLRGQMAEGKTLRSTGGSLETTGMGAVSIATNRQGVIHESINVSTRAQMRHLRRLRRLYQGGGFHPWISAYQQHAGNRRGNPAPLAIMGMGPLPLGLVNPIGDWFGSKDKGPGEEGHGPRHKELQPKYERQKLTLEEAKAALIEAYGEEEGERQFANAFERGEMFHGKKPAYAEAITYDDGKEEHTVKAVVALGMVPETHYTTPWPSNKKGYHWIHKHKKGNEPIEVLDPETGVTMKIGGEFRVTDWWREKKKNT
jgi:hypothetical protein